MWNDSIIAEIHKIRADITAHVGANSRALTLEAKRLSQAAEEKHCMQWKRVAPLSDRKSVV